MAYSDGCALCGQAFTTGSRVVPGDYAGSSTMFRHANCEAKDRHAHPAYMDGPPQEVDGAVIYLSADDDTQGNFGGDSG